MQAVLLVKTNESHVILYNAFPNLEAISPRYTPTNWTTLDLIYKKLNSVALVRKRTIPTVRPLHVGEVSAKLCGYKVLRGHRNEFPRQLISVF
jgi:hypothetical protein